MADDKKKLNQQDDPVTPKKRRVSQKQKDALDLEKKKREYAEDYVKYLKEADDDWIFPKDYPRETEAQYITRKLKENKNNEFKIPRGIYQEPGVVEREYKWRFLQALKQTSSHIFEELRPLSINFKGLFGDIINDAGQENSYQQMDKCLEKLQQLGEKIDNTIINNGLLQLLPDHTYGFKGINYPAWKRIILPLVLLKNLHKPDDINFASPLSAELLNWFKEKRSNSLESHNMPHLKEAIRERIVKFFDKTSAKQEEIYENYLILQASVYEWLRKHCLEEYWLLEFSYNIIFQFSLNQSLPVESIDLPIRQVYRQLQADEFVFKRPGWWAGKISARDYEKYLMEEFKKFLPMYFHNAYIDLKLDKKTQVTKTKDPTYKSIYFLIAWNEGATNPQIAEAFSEFYSRKPFGDIVKDAMNGLEKYELPKRADKPGRKSSSPVSNERLAVIKNALIKNIEEEITFNIEDKSSLKKILSALKKR